MDDWLSERLDWIVSFFVGALTMMFLGGRAYQRLKSTQDEHGNRIKVLERSMKDALDRQSREAGKLFDKIEAVRGEVHQIGVQQSSLASAVDQYGKRMDALVQRYDRANERAEALMQQNLEALRKFGWQPKGDI